MKPLIVLLFLVFQFNQSLGQVSLKDINLENGAYPVGFKHYSAVDSTRTYSRIYDWNNKSIPRPIPVSVWYPSAEDAGNPGRLSVLDYMEILKEEEEWEHLPNEHILNWFYYPNTPQNREHLKEQSTAFFGGAPVKGKFPVVVYAPSYQASSVENFALCEYLASHGYVIISSPSRGSENRFFEGGTAKDMETQARDIEFLINEVAKFPLADNEQVATMGFSFGGLSNVLSQMRNRNIDAIVSLDGSIRYQYTTFLKSAYADINKVDIPFIHMAQKDIPEQVLKEDKIDAGLNHKFEFYDSLVNSTAYSLKFHNLTHSHFSTLGVLFQPRDSRQDKSDPEIMESYKWVSVYTLNFLDAYLKNVKNAEEFLRKTPVENDIKDELITIRVKHPEKKEFSFPDFNELAAKQHYAELKELYDNLSKKHPGLELAEGSLNNLGLQLVFNPTTAEWGIQVFLLATTLYPQSANLFDSLAEAYLFLGDKEKAKANFNKSLQLNAENQNAIDRLRELE